MVPEYQIRCSGAGCEYRFKLPDATVTASIDLGSRCECGGPISDPTYKLQLNVKRPPAQFGHFRDCVVCVFCDRDLRDYVAMMRDAPAGPTGNVRTRASPRPSPIQSPAQSPTGAARGGRGGRGKRAAGGAGAASKRARGGGRGGGRGDAGGRAAAKCYKCNGMGHWAQDCPQG